METKQQIIIQGDEQTLKTHIHVAVQNAVKDIIEKLKVEKPVQLKEASDFFSMTPHSLMKKAHNGEIPYYRFNGSRSPYYFYKSQIAEVLGKGKVVTLKDVLGDDFKNV
tara:strand:+ start:100 stop:426 length:327 start_codon:yes stop_codon:yes gene_type:complete